MQEIQKKKPLQARVCIIGAGSGGFGCAYRLAKNGISVVVVDRNPGFGGTSVYGGVHAWEPGVSLPGVHTVLRDLMMETENACSAAKTVPNGHLFGEREHSGRNLWGLSVPCNEPYETTMQRCIRFTGGDYAGACRRFQFEGEALRLAMSRAIAPFGESVSTLFGYTLTDAKCEGNRIVSVTVAGGNTSVEIAADYFVDASGSIVLARRVGCEFSVGCESRDTYGEPSAPVEAESGINGTTYVFRVRKAEDENHIDEIPPEYRDYEIGGRVNTVSCFNLYPCGDINVNMLPTMTGEQYLAFGRDADFHGHATVWQYWNGLQKDRRMKGYTLTQIFEAGIREDYRLVGRSVLTQNDLRRGVFDQPHPERMIAVADHAQDVHGMKGSSPELDIPYGIPIDCCMAKEYDNLLVACRGASFSHIAASSARLSRTMLSLGEGVGEYIAEMLIHGQYRNRVQGDAYRQYVDQLRTLWQIE